MPSDPVLTAASHPTTMRPRGALLLLGLLLVAVVVALYWPVHNLELAGDDFLLVQMAHRASIEPGLLLAPLDSFFRPTTTWTLVLDRALWGTNAGGYHLTNVALRVVTSLLLFALGLRLGLGRMVAFTVALLWACSPLSAEPVYVVGARIDECLAACWFGALLVSDRGNGRVNTPALWLVLLLAAVSKETWVMIPVTLSALAWVRGRLKTRRNLLAQVPPYAAAAAYSLLYFALLPGDKGYFRWDFSFLAKLTHQAGAMLQLEPLVPIGFTATWRGILALAALSALVVAALRLRSTAGVAGSALLVAATLPTMLVPFLPARYTSLPFAGVLLLVAGVGSSAAARASRPLRRLLVATGGVVAGLAFVAGLFTVRADLGDTKRVSDATASLLSEARMAAPSLPPSTPVIVVRAERANPLLELGLDSRGTPKYYFVRHDDAYGLTDTAALFDWVVDNRRGVVVALDHGGATPPAGPARVLIHRNGGFTWLPRIAESARDEVTRWRSSDLRTRIVELVPPTS